MSKHEASDFPALLSIHPSHGLLNGEKKKRKHLFLSLAQKVELLQKLDAGFTDEYGVGTTTTCDLKKQKDKLLKLYRDSDNQQLMKNRKTLNRAKSEDLDHVLIQQR